MSAVSIRASFYLHDCRNDRVRKNGLGSISIATSFRDNLPSPGEDCLVLFTIHIQESVFEWLQENGALCCCETLKFDILLQLISPGKKPPSNTSKKIAAAAAVGVAATAVGVVAAPVIAGAALGAAGFTSAGVAAGSIAAGVQSAVYGGSVAAGSLFALCQSAGATGVIGSAATAAIGGGTGLTGIAATLGSFKLFVRHSYIF